jgi:hypothetical protein
MLDTFYRDVLPQDGFFALFRKDNKQHVWCADHDELVYHSERLANVPDVYFATAAYKAPSQRSQDNVQALRALRLDLDAGPDKHARDPDRTYVDATEAVRAFVEFTRAIGLAPSYLIHSGAGLHVYYCLEHDAGPDEWLHAAVLLGKVCKALGLKADRAVTKDSARVLRAPGSLHYSGNRVQVLRHTGRKYTLTYIVDVLQRHAPEETQPDLPAGAPPKAAGHALNQDILDSIKGPPKSLEKIIERCGAMRHVAQQRGNVPEPLWRAMLGIVKYTKNPEDALALSDGHPEFDPAATMHKMERWTAGPTTCSEFDANCDACGSCEHRGKVKSPIMLGLPTRDDLVREKVEQAQAAGGALVDDDLAGLDMDTLPPDQSAGQPWEGMIPQGFSVIEHNGKWCLTTMRTIEVKSPTGDKSQVQVVVPITYDMFWLGAWTEAGGTDDNALATLHVLIDGVVRTYDMDQSLAANRRKLLEFLAGKAVHLTTNKKAADAVEDYIKANLQRIRDGSKRFRVNHRFGVRIDAKGRTVCAHGKYVIFPDGTIQEGMMSSKMREYAEAGFSLPLPPSASGEWSPDVWRTHLIPKAHQYVAFLRKYYEREGMENFQLALTLGLASPLMPFVTGDYHRGENLPSNGVTVALYSRDSGRGKSAMNKVLMAAFGDPAATVKDSNQLGATIISRVSKLSTHGTMPVTMEEVGQSAEDSVAAVVSLVANASGRDRAGQKGEYSPGRGWALVNLMSTNRSIRDMIAASQKESAAIQNRIIELDINRLPDYDEGVMASFNKDFGELVHHCAGAFGALLHLLICKLGAARLNVLVSEEVNRARSVIGASQESRFQWRAMGAALAMRRMLKAAGIEFFDENVLVEAFKESYRASAEYVDEVQMPDSGVELMGMFLNDIKDRTLITDTETSGYGFKQGQDQILNLRLPSTVVARHVQSLRATYVSTAALREWAREHRVSERIIIADCKKHGVLVPIGPPSAGGWTRSMDLFKGTKEHGGSMTRVYRINLPAIWADFDPQSYVNVTGIEQAAQERKAS